MLEVVRGVVDEIGSERTAIRLSPVTPANGIEDDNPQQLFDYLLAQLGPLGLAYVHTIEGATGAALSGCRSVCEMRPTCHSCATMVPPAWCTALVTCFQPSSCSVL